jgi:hypothetical protein
VAAALGCTSSQPESIGLFDAVAEFPLTRRSKSSSVVPLASSDDPATAPKAMKSSAGSADEPLVLPLSSCSFFVCSSSTFLDNDLMRSMNAWNCLRSNNGPRLMDQRIGRISMATNSASAVWPTTLMSFRLAIITAGSFVLMPLTRGTIFSCIVYLSSIEDDVDLLSCMIPSRPSSPAPSADPPQSMQNACSPRTLIAKLVVLLNIVEMTGNNSFLIVLKSITGRITGRLLNAASMSEGVGDSSAA